MSCPCTFYYGESNYSGFAFADNSCNGRSLIIVIIYQFVLVPSQKELQCPVCGSTSIEKIPKRWVTSPGEITDLGPISLTSHYQYKCRVCKNEWEDY